MTLVNLAPIVLFVYNRLWHTQQTIEALQKNELASESELFIYADGTKNEKLNDQVLEVRSYIKEVDGFSKVTIIERDKNWGLAANIIDGVTNVINQYGKIIVMEDDIVTSPAYLSFMNQALDFYKNEQKVWHISGWNYPIDSKGLGDVFLWRVMNCWGWATWANRWEYYEKDVYKTMQEFSKDDIKRFNVDGVENFFGQVTANYEKKINTWAIFWYATIFKKNGLCLNSTQTFVENIGLDRSGVHCGESSTYISNISLNKKVDFIYSDNENNLALQRIKIFYTLQKKTFSTRVINKIARILTGKNIIK